MACSNPLRIFPKVHSWSSRNPDLSCLTSSLGDKPYYTVPCGMCLSCRVDKVNQLTDRAEYELCKYSCGAFVTFTYDDPHLYADNNVFYSTKKKQILSSLSKYDCKKFLDRLNKIVHAEFKKHGFNPLCRPDYKYLIVGEYGENGQVFDRCHYHALFFGLDYAFCERLFWKAWNYKGSIQVGSIRNGGIGYCLKYLDKQVFGKQAFYKYDYYGMERPFQFHSSRFGEGLYRDQLDYIRKHNGNYRWHGVDKPVPSYYKNKFLIIEDKKFDYMVRKYKDRKAELLDRYGKKIENFDHLQKIQLDLNRQKEMQMIEKLRQKGKPIFNYELVQKEINRMVYGNRLPGKSFDDDLVKVIKNNGEAYLKPQNGYKLKSHLTVRDLMKMHTDYNKFRKKYGFDMAEKYIQPDSIPF